MRQSFSNTRRVLAIDPYHKGFGFAVLEEPLQLIDFGLKIPTTGKGKGNVHLKKVERIIDHYRPDVLVVEDSQARECRRWRKARDALHGIEKLASYRNVEYVRLSRSVVYQIVASQGTPTKYIVAVEIAKRFPELESYLPRPRKSWDSEYDTMNIFDATALALCFYLRMEEEVSNPSQGSSWV